MYYVPVILLLFQNEFITMYICSIFGLLQFCGDCDSVVVCGCLPYIPCL